MDELGELSTNKDKSPLNVTYFHDNYDIPNQVNLLPTENVLNNPSNSVSLPPPLPGVFVFDQPGQTINKSLIDSNFSPLVTSSYDSNAQTLSDRGPNQYNEVVKPLPEMISTQKYFQSSTLNVYDYQTSEQKRLDKLQSVGISDVDSMLPPQGNVYQSLQPVPVNNVFDTSSYCEPKVYQQLEPVLKKNEYRVDMEKFVEQKFYQELNPLNVNDSKLPKNEKKTYQQLRSVPDLHFIGGQSGARSTTRTTQQKPEIPPEYATSKLYQQLSKPPKKQARTSYSLEVKSYHQSRPAVYVDKPKQSLMKSLSQRVGSSTPRPVTTQMSSKVYYQQQITSQSYQHEPYETFQNVRVNNYQNDIIDQTINPNPATAVSFPSKTQTVQKGFQEHKPKIYLELRNPVPRKQTSLSSGSLQTSVGMDPPYQDAATRYDDGSITGHVNTQYQNINPLNSHVRVNDMQTSMRLPSPYEFKLPHINMSGKPQRMPKILGPNEYNESISAYPMLDTSINHLSKSFNKVVSSTAVKPPYCVGEEISVGSVPVTSHSFPKSPDGVGGRNTSGAGENKKDADHLRNKNDRNIFPIQNISDITTESVPDLSNQPIDNNRPNSCFSNVSSSLFEKETIQNLSSNNINRSSIVKGKSYLTKNETDFKVVTDNSENKHEVDGLNRSNSNLDIIPIALENSNVSLTEIKSDVSFSVLGSRNVMSTGDSTRNYSSNTDSNEGGSQEKVLLHQKQSVISTFGNIEDLSNSITNVQLANKYTVNRVHNQINENKESGSLVLLSDTMTRAEENLKKKIEEEPTDLSLNLNSCEKKLSSSCLNKNSTPSGAKSSSEISTVQNSCSASKETSGFSEVTSQDKFLNESNQICLQSSSPSQLSGALFTQNLVKEPKLSTDEKIESVKDSASNSTKIICEKDLAKSAALSEVDEKALSKLQLSSKQQNTPLSDQNLDTEFSRTQLSSKAVKASPNTLKVSSNDRIESVVNSVQSELKLMSNQKIKGLPKNYNVSGNSELTSEQNSDKLKTQSNIFKEDHNASRHKNMVTPVETESAVPKPKKSVGDLYKTGEDKDKLHFESSKNANYTSFIPKKNRILYKTQLFAGKSSESDLEMATDSKSVISLSQKNSVLSEKTCMEKTSKVQSESQKTLEPIGTVCKQETSTFESCKLSEPVDKTTESAISVNKIEHKAEEKEEVGCESLNQTIACDKSNLVSETHSNVMTEKILPPKRCIVLQSNTLVKSLAKLKWQNISNEDKTQIERNETQALKNIPKNKSALLKKQPTAKKEKQYQLVKPKMSPLKQHSGRSLTLSPIKEETGSSRIINTLSETCSTNISTINREKELNVDDTAEVQSNESERNATVCEQNCSSLGTRSSMKRKVRESSKRISESISKHLALRADSKSLPEGSIKVNNPSVLKSAAIKDTVKNLRNSNVLENLNDGIKSIRKTVTRSSSLNKSKSARVDILQEKRSLKRKRKYCKATKFEVVSTAKKAEPLLKSKYSKRIIKKKKLDFEPLEPVKKPKKLLKRNYTVTKNKDLVTKRNSCESETTSCKSLPTASAKTRYKMVDPLKSTIEVRAASKEGLITDDEGETVFLGFDSPQEEDDTVLGFDFKEEEDEDLEPINEFLQQLDADSMTVECDPRSLLQVPGTTSQCPQCGKRLSSHQELVDHVQWHHDSSGDSGPFVCCMCSRVFGTQAQLDKHTKWNHEGGKRFTCPVCSKRFTTGNYVKKHLATVHGQQEAELKYICPDCTLSFPSEKKLSKHMDKVHKKTLYQCNKCLKNFLKLANLERHKLSHEGDNQKFPCAYCNEKFNNRAQLHTHWSVHTEKKLFTCEICSSTFTALPSLRRHKILHAGEKLYRCDICKRSFALMSTLKTHLLIHSGIKRFPCNLCDKTFNRQDVLNAHQWIHTGEKKFECDVCSEKFRWRHAVKSHKLIYHSTEKPYECEICGKRFSHPESFKKHGEVHAEKLYYCQICLKAFSRPSSLKIHLLIHTDIKPFVCDLCNKTFRHKSHLRKHFLVHTSEKPWLCKFCNRMYKDRSQLRRHKRIVHCKSFFNRVLPGMPESLKTIENFEMITEGDAALYTNQECFQESEGLNSENSMSRKCKHFILSNLGESFSNSEDNSVPDSTEDKSSNTEENKITSFKEDHSIDKEENDMSQSNASDKSSPLTQENVLPCSAF